ncbi:MAG: peptidase M16 [Crocinitomicaceae bacterium]|nr:peptidase M16 [Crocinitomicaceae bacterium]
MKATFKAIALLIAAAPIALVAQIDRSSAPAAGPAPIIELGESTVSKLENGLTVIVVENHRIPQVSWSLDFEHTPVFEGDKVGILGMFGDLMKSGTVSKSKAELDEAIDFIGGSIYASSNYFSGSSLTKHSDALLELMSDVLFNPSFPEAELNKLKTQMISGLAASETSPNDISSNLTRTLLYGSNHPYGEVTTAESIEAITREDFINHHNTYFRPNSTYLVIVGNITFDNAMAQAEKWFGSWEKSDIPYHRWETPALPQGNKVCLAPLDGSVQSLLKLTHIVNLRPGSEDAITVSVMNSILGGGAFSGRLMQNLREDKAFTYGARSSLSTDPIVGNFVAYADVRNEVTDSAVTEFLIEIRRMTNEPVDSSTLAMTKSYMTGSFARSLENPSTVARFALNIEKYGLPADYYATYLEELSMVTIEDVQRVAKKYLRPDQLYITCVGSPEIIESLKGFSHTGQVELFDAYGKQLIERRDVSEGVTGESVVANHYNACGGLKKISKLKSIVKKGSVEIGGAMTLGFEEKTSYSKKNKKSMKNISMSGQVIMTSTVTPEGASISQMGPEEKLEGADLIVAQWTELSPVFLNNSDDYGLNADLLGIENINGVEYHVIKYTNEDDSISESYYFSVESGLLSMSKNLNSSTEYNKYIDLGDGILFPLEVKVTSGPQSMNFRISSVELNSTIE